MKDYDEELDLSKYRKYKYEETNKYPYTEIEDLKENNNSVDASEQQNKAEHNKDEKFEKTKSTFQSKFRETITFLSPIAFALILALLLRGFVFINAQIPTGSMEHTIAAGSKVIASRLSYVGDKKPERFDVVIFKFPDDEKENYVKRVIGLPGEKVEIIDGKVYIDDSKTPLRDDFVTTGDSINSFGPFYVPEDCYFMLGDNRDNSKDSRYWINKYVNEKKILGEVKFIYSPKFEKIDNK